MKVDYESKVRVGTTNTIPRLLWRVTFSQYVPRMRCIRFAPHMDNILPQVTSIMILDAKHRLCQTFVLPEPLATYRMQPFSDFLNEKKVAFHRKRLHLNSIS